MEKIKSIALKGSFSRYQIKESLLVLTISVILPFLFHFLPAVNGKPVGAFFLPMFFAPLVATLLFRIHVALIPALLSSIVNYFLTGHPAQHLIFVLTFELVLFVLFVKYYNTFKELKYFAGSLGYVSAKIISSSLLFFVPLVKGVTPVAFFVTSISTALPGIIILFVITLSLSIIPFNKEEV